MDNISRFFSYSDYLRKKYREKAFRVAVDGGFSCPNRKDRESPGCVYCDAHGARATYIDRTVLLREQIERGKAFLEKRYNARIFLLYFQAFTGTYAPADTLNKTWDYALSLGEFRELIISTRPDCIDREKALLISSYIKKDFDVWVELGLQSSSNRTLERINRGHTSQDFLEAFNLLRSHGIKVTVHLIFGLPGENESEIMETVRFVSALRPEGVKFHNLHVTTGTELEREYLAGELSVPCIERHVRYLAKAAELLPPETVIMRMTCDTPSARRLAPGKTFLKGGVIKKVEAELERMNSRQGKLYKD